MAYRGPGASEATDSPGLTTACGSATFTFDNIAAPSSGAAVAVAENYNSLVWGNWGAVKSVAAAAAVASAVASGKAPVAET